MKFIIAVVMLALAAHASASAVQTVDVANRYAPVGTYGPALVNLGAPHGLGYGAYPGYGGVVVGSPYGAAPLIGLNQGLVGVGGYAAYPAWAGAYPAVHSAVPAVHSAVPAVHAAVPALGLAHGHEGKYVAANRGSVHVAPLTGHIQSVNSANLQPAPGTTW